MPTRLFNIPPLAELVGIWSTQIDETWNEVLPFVERALEHSYETPQRVYEFLKEKKAQLWVAKKDGAIVVVCVTQVSEYPKGNTCGIWICTGTGRADWQHHIRTIEAWAKSNGCVAMRSEARMGWQRVLKPMGYEATHVTLEKAL